MVVAMAGLKGRAPQAHARACYGICIELRSPKLPRVLLRRLGSKGRGRPTIKVGLRRPMKVGIAVASPAA